MLALAITLTVSHASARRRQALPRGQVGIATLSVSVAPGLKAEVESLDEPGAPVLSCVDACAAEVPEGRYRLTLLMQDDSDSMDVRLFASVPWLYHGRQPNYGLKYFGLTSVITGGALAITGITALCMELLPRLFLALLPHGGDETSEPISAWGIYGAATLPLGVALAVVGFLLFKGNRRPFVQERVVDPPALRSAF